MERTSARVLRPLLSILMAFIYLYSATVISFDATFMNPNFWKGLLSMEFIEEYIMDPHNDLDDYSKKDQEKIKKFFDGSVEIMLAETFEVLNQGDTEFDEDRFSDFVDKHIDDLTEIEGVEEDILYGGRDKLEREFKKSCENLIEDISDDIDVATFVKVHNAITISSYVGLGLICALTILLVFIHRNKFVIIRSTGIYVFVCEVLILGVLGLFYVSFMSFLDAGNTRRTDEVSLLFSELLKRVTYVHVAIAAVALFMIIFGAIIAKKYYDSMTNDANETQDSDYSSYNTNQVNSNRYDYDDELE